MDAAGVCQCAPPERIDGIMAGMSETVAAAGFEFRKAASADEYWLSQVLVRASEPRIGQQLLRTAKETEFSTTARYLVGSLNVLDVTWKSPESTPILC